MMEESNKDNEDTKISVESVRNALKNILGGLTNQGEALCRTNEVPGSRSEAFDFKMFVGDIEKIYIPKMKSKRSIEILKGNSPTTEKCDTDRNIEEIDLCKRNYQARNISNTLEEINMKSNSNTIFEKPFKLSASNSCYSDDESEQAFCDEYEPLQQSSRNADESRKISRTIMFDEEYDSSSSDLEEDCFSYTYNTAYTDKNSNSMKISREDSPEFSKGEEDSSRALKDIQGFLNGDLMIPDIRKWPRLLYYRQLCGKDINSYLTLDEFEFLRDISHRFESPETLSPHCLLGSNRVSEDSRIKENQGFLNRDSPIPHLDASSNSPLYRQFSEKKTASFKTTDEEMEHRRFDLNSPKSIPNISESRLVPIRVLKPSEIGQSNFKFSDSSKVSKPYKKSPSQSFKSKQNILNMDEMQDIIHPDYVTEFSNLQYSIDNHQGSLVSSEEKEENAVSKICNITENKCDPDASICSDDRNTETQKDSSGSSLIPSKDTTLSSNSPKNYSCNVLSSDSDTDTSDYDLMFPDSDYEPNERLDPKKPQNLFNTTYDFPDFSMNAHAIKEFSLDTASTFCSQGIKNSDICDRLDSLLGSKTAKRIEKTFSDNNTRITRSVSNFSDRNKRTFEYDSKLSDTDQDSPKKSKISCDEKLFLSLMKIGGEKRKKSKILNRSAALGYGRRSPIHYDHINYSNSDTPNYSDTPDDPDTLDEYDTLEDLDTDDLDDDLDSLDDFFKTVIKCNPIEKFEIPPYASTNTERISGKLKNPFVKHTSTTTQLDDIKEQQNILKCFTDMDSTSVINFEVTDCLSQNSSLICENLRKEYLEISAKVNWLLIKQTRDISTEEYQLRIRNLRSLDDELGYVSAKLITVINDWEKQLLGINDKIAQSRISSQGLHQMGLLRICKKLAWILLKFILEKQLKLEDYENILVINRKQEQ